MQLTNEIKELLLSEIDNAIIVCDASGNTTWVNKTFEAISEFSLHEVLGRKPGEVLQGPDTALEDVQAISEALSKNEPIKKVVLNYTKSGRAYWNSLEIKPIFVDEKLAYYFSIQRDVTQQVLERNMLKAAEAKYRKLFDNIAVGVTFIGYDGNILGCNDKELSIMGYTREEYYTKSIFELVESKYRQRKKYSIKRYLQERLIIFPLGSKGSGRMEQKFGFQYFQL